jgi:class 3 adenylate cyclase/tetratricopeptide (TPR) repeat protein
VIYVFEDYSLDTDRRELRRDGSLVAVQPQVFDLLQYLISQRERVVSKDDLISAVWGGRIVSESTLSSRITGVRQAISDSGDAQRLIRTIARKGLRFVGEVREEQRSTGAAAVPAALSQDETVSEWRGAQRRHVTILACDVLGPAALRVHLDPEDLRDAMEACSQRVKEVVERHGGFIAETTADRLLVCFGYPQSSEDDAERAVRTGLALVQAVAQLKFARLDNPLQPRIGVATGVVVIGDTGPGATAARMLIGEPLLLATRLLAVADQGEVVISTDTQRLVSGLFECEDLGQVTFEGLASPLGTSRVLRESATVSRFDALHPSRTRLIGRGEELDLLLRRWSQARSGDGRVVLVTGEAGLGKSRLIHALQEELASEPLVALRYDCSPHQRDTALYPIARQLLRSAGIAPDDSAEDKLRKLEALLRQSNEDLAECMPLFAALLSIPDSDRYPSPKLMPERLRERTLAALLGRVRRLAAGRPVLMVFEDLQWVDPTSLDLVCQIVDQMPGLPVLLLATFRPGFTPPWPAHRHVSTIALSHLGASESAALVKDVASARTLAPEVIAQIVARADGVPLFIEELTKAVLEGGLTRWEAAASRHRSIPSTLHASLVARLDRLGAAKQVAQIGAAIGRDFSYRLIAAVSALPEADLKAALSRLTEAELIFQRGMPPDATYIFKHALVQEAAYDTLLRDRRKQLHARIGETLEGHFPEIVVSQPGLLAQHCAEAGLSEKAVAYWLAAGQQAWAQSAAPEAVAQLQKGLAVLGDLPDGPRRRQHELNLQIALRPALAAMKGSSAADVGETIARARALAEQIDRPDSVVPLILGQWVFHLVRSEHRLALPLAVEIEKIGRARNDVVAQLQGRRAHGWTCCYRGDFVAARALLEQCHALGDPAHGGFTAGLAEAPYPAMLAYLAVTLAHLGHIDQARSRLNDALSESCRLRHVYTRALVLLCASWTDAITDSAELKQHAEELQAISADGLPTFLAYGTAFRGLALTRLGEAEEGCLLLTQGLSMLRATGTALNAPRLLMGIGEAHAMLGRPAEGLNCLAEAARILEITDERVNEAELHRLRGDLLNVTGDRTAAEQAYHQALAAAERQSAKLFELRAATGLARLWGPQGKRAEARDLLTPVCNWFTEGFDTRIFQEAKAVLRELGQED